jgi:hypothetical protein
MFYRLVWFCSKLSDLIRVVAEYLRGEEAIEDLTRALELVRTQHTSVMLRLPWESLLQRSYDRRGSVTVFCVVSVLPHILPSALQPFSTPIVPDPLTIS